MCERRYTEDAIRALQTSEPKTVYIVEGGDELFDAVADYILNQPVLDRMRLTIRLTNRLENRGVYMGDCYVEALRINRQPI